MRIGDDPRAAAESIAVITRFGAERVCRYAFEYARRTGARRSRWHKANILKFSQGLFLDVGQVARSTRATSQFDERIIDAMAMQLVINPEQFDVIVTTNLFGDILSDLISGLVGGLGLAPGANIGKNGGDLRGGARDGAVFGRQERGQPQCADPRGLSAVGAHRRRRAGRADPGGGGADPARRGGHHA
jgi:isocitrate/isopropylmalate dehydrogenase